MKTRALSLCVALIAAGCVVVPSAEHPALVAQRVLIGMSRSELLSCVGAPIRQVATGDREYLTYSAWRTETGRPPWSSPFGPWRHDWVVYHEYCDATFTVRRGVVERLVYGGDAVRGYLDQCGVIVFPCIPPASLNPPMAAPPPATTTAPVAPAPGTIETTPLPPPAPAG